MKTVIIDDKAAIRQTVKLLLDTYAAGEFEVVGEADSVASGLACITEHEPELVLLDVEMEDGTGFDLLVQLQDPTFKVVFITAHDGYALKAFRFSAVDYILKPIVPSDFIKALNKAKESWSLSMNQQSIGNLLTNRQKKAENQQFLLSDADNIFLVKKEEIIRCEAAGNYTIFFLTKDRKITVSRNLKEYIELLDSDDFFRAHKSHFINLKQFDRLEKKDGGIIHMQDGSTLPVAVRRKDLLLEALSRL